MKPHHNNRKLLSQLATLGVALLLGACDFYLVNPQTQMQNAAQNTSQQDTQAEQAAPVEPPAPPTPLPGSSDIVFMDSTTAQLDGCRALSTVRFMHNGKFSDGMIALRNSAQQINANRMVPLRLVENVDNQDGPHFFQVRLMRCPKPSSKEAQTNG